MIRQVIGVALLVALSASPSTASRSAPVTAAPHYDVDLRLSPARAYLAADTRITLPAQTAGTTIEYLLGRSYGVPKIDAPRGASVEIGEASDSFRRIKVRFGRDHPRPVLRFRYAGPLGPSGEPPLNSISPRLIELNLDSKWLPIVSDFATMFTADARIRGIPANAVTVAQGQMTRWNSVVRVSRRLTDIDIAFVAAPALQRVVDGPLEFYARDVASQRALVYRSHGKAALLFLERWFGRSPVSPTRVVQVERPRISGYARRGYVVVTADPAANPAGSAKFIAHEFAHGWFRNADTSGGHRWIDESIAEYVSLRYVEAALGVGAKEEMLARKRVSAAKAGAVVGPNRGDPELYAKGAILLHELEERVGREKLDRVIARAAADRIATTAGFVTALEAVAGRDAAREFEKRLRS